MRICGNTAAVPHRGGHAPGRYYLPHSDEHDAGWIGTVSAREAAYKKENRGKTHFNKLNFVRYADDFIIVGESPEFLRDKVLPIVKTFLAERGLQLSEEKTVITHIDDGFDFLGKNIRKYGGKLLIKPSKTTVKSFLGKVRDIIKSNKSTKQEKKLREYSGRTELTTSLIIDILSDEMLSPVKITLKKKCLSQYFPKDYTQQQMEEVIFSLLETWKSQQKGAVPNDSDG